MEKIILVYYISVGNMEVKEIFQYMEKISKDLYYKEEENIIQYFIPIRNGETRVECVNPKIVTEEDYKEAKKVLDKNQEIVNNIINWKSEIVNKNN